jgi:hypothetical protein
VVHGDREFFVSFDVDHHYESIVHACSSTAVAYCASDSEQCRRSCSRDLHFPASLLLQPPLDNRLQLPRIAQRVLNDLIARNQDILAQIIVLLLREVYPAILDNPSALLCKVDDAALGIEEEERLGVGHGDGGVRALATRSDFLADCADENL